MKYTIFSIDNAQDLRQQKRFLRFIDERKAMSQLSGNFIFCIGMYKNTMEPAYLCLTSDFKKFVRDSGYVDEQESVLEFSEGRHRYADLVFPDGSRSYLGVLKKVSAQKAWSNGAFTYRPDMDAYFVAV